MWRTKLCFEKSAHTINLLIFAIGARKKNCKSFITEGFSSEFGMGLSYVCMYMQLNYPHRNERYFYFHAIFYFISIFPEFWFPSNEIMELDFRMALHFYHNYFFNILFSAQWSFRKYKLKANVLRLKMRKYYAILKNAQILQFFNLIYMRSSVISLLVPQ